MPITIFRIVNSGMIYLFLFERDQTKMEGKLISADFSHFDANF